MRMIARWALATLAVLALAACGDRGGETAAELTPSSRTLADSASGNLARVIENAGLEEALDGVGPYTLFAPPDGALGGDPDFTDAALKAESAALLQAHIVPGAITRADIAAAIDKGGGRAEMRTMAGSLLTFSREGDSILVTAPGATPARLTGAESLASNGALQPLDAILAPVGPPTPG